MVVGSVAVAVAVVALLATLEEPILAAVLVEVLAEEKVTAVGVDEIVPPTATTASMAVPLAFFAGCSSGLLTSMLLSSLLGSGGWD